MAARKLAAVPDDPSDNSNEKLEEPEVSQSVKSAAATSQRDLLVALRDKIAGDIDEGVPARDLASLSRRLLEIAGQIAELDSVEEGDDVSDAAETPDEAWTT